MPFRVLLVEDDPRTRARLARVISADAGLSLVAACDDLASAHAVLDGGDVDVLLTDLALPDGHGVELVRRAGDLVPPARCLVISVFGDEANVVDSIRAGASGYLLKDASAREIGRAITELMAGGAPISPSVARYLLKQIQVPSVAPPVPPRPEVDALSRRECEVLQLVADGCSYAEIAGRLFISVNTVGTHIKHIYDKLAVNSRGRAVREAEQRGLLRRPGGAHGA